MFYTLFFGVLLINNSARIRPLSVIEVLSLDYSKSSYQVTCYFSLSFGTSMTF